MEFVGLTVDQLLVLAGLAVVLFLLLLVLRTVLKLTKAFLKLGCLGIVFLLVIAFFVLQTLS